MLFYSCLFDQLYFILWVLSAVCAKLIDKETGTNTHRKKWTASETKTNQFKRHFHPEVQQVRKRRNLSSLL